MKTFYKVVDYSDNYYGTVDIQIEEIELPEDSKLDFDVFVTKQEAQDYLDRLYYHRLTD